MQARFEVRFVEVEGVPTRCLVAGRPGPRALLLLHGYGGTADVWYRNIDALAERYFVVAPDMLGAGFTRPAAELRGAPQPAAVRHLLGLMDALGVERFCPMGTSYGSGIAALLYFEAPQRVERMVLNGTGTCFHTEEELAASLTRLLTNFRPVFAAPTVQACRTAVATQLYVKSAMPEEILPVMATAYAQPWIGAYWEAGLRALIDAETSRPYAILDRLEQLDVETLIIWGRQDAGASYEAGRRGAERMPRARFVTFEECGHKPMLEYPAKYHDTVLGFLNT